MLSKDGRSKAFDQRVVLGAHKLVVFIERVIDVEDNPLETFGNAVDFHRCNVAYILGPVQGRELRFGTLTMEAPISVATCSGSFYIWDRT